VAAQLLAGQGFKEVYNLKGGIKAWNGLKAVGPAEVGMAVITGDETPSQMIKIAFGMEEGLRSFYEAMSPEIKDSTLSGLFRKLSKIEVAHKERLFRHYRTLEGGPAEMTAFEEGLASDLMEGGMTTEEFLEFNRPAMETPQDVLSMAMILETQSLDLYMRYAARIKEEGTRGLLHDLADQEKAHLKELGNLLDKEARSHRSRS